MFELSLQSILWLAPNNMWWMSQMILLYSSLGRLIRKVFGLFFVVCLCCKAVNGSNQSLLANSVKIPLFNGHSPHCFKSLQRWCACPLACIECGSPSHGGSIIFHGRRSSMKFKANALQREAWLDTEEGIPEMDLIDIYLKFWAAYWQVSLGCLSYGSELVPKAKRWVAIKMGYSSDFRVYITTFWE